MKLADCRMGAIVAAKPDALETDELRIGHVVGLTMSTQGTPAAVAGRAVAILNQIQTKPAVGKPVVVPLVLFAGNRDPVAISHESLDLFTAY